MTALLLRDVGCDVHVYERSRAPLQGRGAGIVLHPSTTRYFEEHRLFELDAVSSATSVLRYLDRQGEVLVEVPVRYRFTSYATLYGALVGHLETERYNLSSECVALGHQEDAVELRLADGTGGRFDLVVGADGIGSTVRRLLFPDVVPRYAGYVGWRGTLPERAFPLSSRPALEGAITYFVGRATHMLSYPIPSGDDGRSERLVNWVWYRNVAPGGELADLTTDVWGVRHEMSLPPGTVRPEHVTALRAAAGEELPPQFAELVGASPHPFVQVIVDIGVPRMVVGRVCLVGDAAFALRPHIAVGTAKAAEDARTLADAIVSAAGHVEALPSWDLRQVSLGRDTLARARSLGDSVQFDGTYRPGDRGVLFGLREPGDSSYPIAHNA